MEKFYVNAKDNCTLISTSSSKIDFLLNYSKSLRIIECDGEDLEQNLN
ncbi:hypothetical protein [Arenibacter latericius]|nr:hypothetical protein [Arenibacter latericius]MDX1362945.1 hypothetical protein [Arenibacter latericius]